MNRVPTIASLDSSYNVSYGGEDHDISILAVRRRSLRGPLYPTDLEFKIKDSIDCRDKDWEPCSPTTSGTKKDVSRGKKQTCCDHNRRRHAVVAMWLKDDCCQSSIGDHLRIEARREARLELDDDDDDDDCDDESLTLEEATSPPCTPVDEEEKDGAGYQLFRIGGGVRLPLLGTASETKAAIQEETLDGSSGSLLPETVMTECSLCQANLVCLFGMSHIKCLSCNTIGPVIYDRSDLAHGMVPYGLGLGLRLDRLIM